MARHVFLVDGTGHNTDTRHLITSVNGLLTKYDQRDVAWILRSDQVHSVNGADIVRQTDDPTVVESFVGDWIVRASENGHAGDVFHVLTYAPRVLAAADALNSDSRVVIPSHLANLRDGRHGSIGISSRPVSPSASPLSVEELDELAKRVLLQGRHVRFENALRQSQLRLLMARVDTRVRKRNDDPSTWNIIRELIQRGVREGWLRQHPGAGSGFEVVWLANNDDAAPASAVEAPASPVVPDQSRRQSPTSSQMEAMLRGERIASPPIARSYVFDALESIIQEVASAPAPVSVLIGKVAAEAHRRAALDGYMRDQDWLVISECTLRAMAHAQVLLANVSPARPHIGFFSAKPDSLHPEFRIRTIALLAERLIVGLGEFKMSDLWVLGLVLFQEGKVSPLAREELMARVDGVLTLLLDEGRIRLADLGVILPVHKLG